MQKNFFKLFGYQVFHKIFIWNYIFHDKVSSTYNYFKLKNEFLVFAVQTKRKKNSMILYLGILNKKIHEFLNVFFFKIRLSLIS